MVVQQSAHLLGRPRSEQAHAVGQPGVAHQSRDRRPLRTVPDDRHRELGGPVVHQRPQQREDPFAARESTHDHGPHIRGRHDGPGVVPPRGVDGVRHHVDVEPARQRLLHAGGRDSTHGRPRDPRVVEPREPDGGARQRTERRPHRVHRHREGQPDGTDQRRGAQGTRGRHREMGVEHVGGHVVDVQRQGTARERAPDGATHEDPVLPRRRGPGGAPADHRHLVAGRCLQGRETLHLALDATHRRGVGVGQVDDPHAVGRRAATNGSDSGRTPRAPPGSTYHSVPATSANTGRGSRASNRTVRTEPPPPVSCDP